MEVGKEFEKFEPTSNEVLRKTMIRYRIFVRFLRGEEGREELGIGNLHGTRRWSRIELIFP